MRIVTSEPIDPNRGYPADSPGPAEMLSPPEPFRPFHIDPADFALPEPTPPARPTRLRRAFSTFAKHWPEIRAALEWLVSYESSHRGSLNWRELALASTWALAQYLTARGLDVHSPTAVLLAGSAGIGAGLILLAFGPRRGQADEPAIRPLSITPEDSAALQARVADRFARFGQAEAVEAGLIERGPDGRLVRLAGPPRPEGVIAAIHRKSYPDQDPFGDGSRPGYVDDDYRPTWRPSFGQ